MRIHNNSTFHSNAINDGRITTEGSAGHVGEFTWKSSSSDTVIFAGGLELRRSLFFNMNVTCGSANEFISEDDEFHMYFGPSTGNSYKLLGSGKIYANGGGTVTFRKMDLNGSGSSFFTGELVAQTNTMMEFTSLATVNATRAYVRANGGTIWAAANLGAWFVEVTYNNAEGQIHAEPSKVAVFMLPL